VSRPAHHPKSHSYLSRRRDYKFEAPQEAPPPEIDDAVRRREEEELQKVLEMSMRDKGGRSNWSDYSAYAPSSSRAGASSSAAAAAGSSSKPSGPSQYSSAPDSSGYVPAQPGPPRADAYTPAPVAPAAPSGYAASMPVATPASAPEPAQPPTDAPIPIVTRVRALHSFEPTEAGELAFEKGDIIKVVDRGYKDWWRGQLKGRTGIFPVNYVVSF
jgi:signal transducing adaptor molecule